jgi:hypothetical protein
MPNSTSVFNERVLNALESLVTDAEAGGGAATLASLQAIEVALEAIQAEQDGATLTAFQGSVTQQTAIKVALEAILVHQATIAAASGASFNVTYIFPAKNWDTTWTEVINTPASKRGRVVDAVVYDVTEQFVDTTTDARVDIGDGADADAFALTSGLGTTAIDASAALAITQGVTQIIPVADVVTVTGITAGTPGNGIATLALTIEYFD